MAALLDYIAAELPRSVILENVKGFLKTVTVRQQHGHERVTVTSNALCTLVQEIAARNLDEVYSITIWTLNSTPWLPQTRRRCYILLVHRDAGGDATNERVHQLISELTLLCTMCCVASRAA